MGPCPPELTLLLAAIMDKSSEVQEVGAKGRRPGGVEPCHRPRVYGHILQNAFASDLLVTPFYCDDYDGDGGAGDDLSSKTTTSTRPGMAKDYKNGNPTIVFKESRTERSSRVFS